MNNNRIGICIFLSLAALLTSCMDEIDNVEVNKKINTDEIVFGGSTANDVVITRSGSAPTSKLTEKVLRSETQGTSLPLFIEVKPGINTAGPATRAAITTTIEEITQLDAWGTKNTYTDASKTQVTKRELFFFGSDGKAETGALFTKEAGNEDLNGDGKIDDIFYPDGNGPYLWEKNASAVSDFNFVTVSPAGSGFKAVINQTNYTVTFDYEVPAAAANQKDVLVAVPAPVNVDYGAPVPLDYKHVMAAVNVKVGNHMPAGIIKSIQFKGVYDKASYYPTTNEWTNRSIKENGGVFNVTLPEGGLTVGPDAYGSAITTAETSFMMIPQQLFTGAELVVEFHDNGTGKDVTLRASIQGDVWEMNTTTNYIINIDANYNVSIVPLDKVLDSHYIITKVEVSSDLPIWSVVATANDGADVTVQLEQEVNPVAKMGFWTDKYASKYANGKYYVEQNAESARGEDNCGGNTSVEGQVIYVFIPENVTGETRTVTLTMVGSATDGSSYAVKTLELTQEPVKWMRDPNNPDSFWGCEILLEGGQVPWGFAWNEYMEVDLRQGGTSKPEGGNIASGRVKAFKQAMSLTGVNADSLLFNPNSYVQIHEAANHNGNQGAQWFICIDLSKLGNITIAPSIINGYQNTYDIYHWDGISFLNSILNFLVNWDGLVESNSDNDLTAESVGLFQNTLDYAAMYAMKRNRFHLYEESIDGSIMQIPIIEEKDLNWYLPAKDQFPYFMNLDWGQSFSFNDVFWTSTGYNKTNDLDPNTAHAYAYLYGMETIAHRKDSYLTFALRRYLESSDVEIGDDDIIIEGGGDNGPEYGEGGGDDGNTGGNIGGGTN